MFDIGWSELFVVMLVALLVLGPEELPVLAKKVGQFLAGVRRQWQAVQQTMQDVADVAAVPDHVPEPPPVPPSAPSSSPPPVPENKSKTTKGQP